MHSGKAAIAKIGICTGGGDCPGLNAAIRAIVKHAVGSYGWQVIGIEESLTGLMLRPTKVRPLYFNDVSGILDRGGTILRTKNDGSPFRKDGQKPLKLVTEGIAALSLDGLIVVGGDGTQGMARILHGEGVPVIGVPKTIDNDLAGTEQCIGFATAVDVATEAIHRIETTAQSHSRVMILEVMGREAGFIALHAGLAAGAHVVLIPEIPFSWDAIIKKIEDRHSLGRQFTVIVVAEGAKEKGGESQFRKSTTGSTHLGGMGEYVAKKLHALAGVETRSTTLGHIQRGGTPNAYDRILATAFGVHAVELAANGKWGRLVSLEAGRITDYRYEDIKERRRPMPMDSDFIRAAEATGICLGRPSTFSQKVTKTKSTGKSAKSGGKKKK